MNLRVVFAAFAASLMLVACGQAANPNGPVVGDVVLQLGNVGEPNSLDPHFSTTNAESPIIGDMLVGLTTAAADGTAIPGAALSWDVSDDGLIWTFHLRDHNWSDGVPVTADDFVYAWRRILDPASAAPYASLLYIFKNAEAIASGEMDKEMLGARAIDAHTLELTLETPAPYLPQFLEHHSTYPVPRHVVEEIGTGWVRANYVVNGPYRLLEWVPNDRITLVKNPEFYDAANVAVDRVVYNPINDPGAGFRRFRANELDALHGIPLDQIDWIRANMPDELHIGPYLAVAAVVINTAKPPFDDVRVREALDLTYDRDTLVQTVVRLGQEPAYSIVPPGIANYAGPVVADFKSLSYPERVSRAQQLMRDAGFGPNNRLSLTFSTNPSQDGRRVAAAVQQMWRAIYVDADIIQQEGNVHFARMREGDYDVGPYGWIADYNDAYNFLFLFLSGNEGMNYAHYKNPAFDAIMDEASRELDLTARGELLAQAERLLLNDHVWIPTRYEVTQNMVHTYVKGWADNVSDTHRTRWISIERGE